MAAGVRATVPVMSSPEEALVLRLLEDPHPLPWSVADARDEDTEAFTRIRYQLERQG